MKVYRIGRDFHGSWELFSSMVMWIEFLRMFLNNAGFGMKKELLHYNKKSLSKLHTPWKCTLSTMIAVSRTAQDFRTSEVMYIDR